jgi:hypothetical protein
MRAILLSAFLITINFKHECREQNCYVEVYEACTSSSPCENEYLSEGYQESHPSYKVENEVNIEPYYPILPPMYPLFTPMYPYQF